MATDQKASIIEADPDQTGAAIENELPTYRAISVIAIFSVVCGGLAVCTFADPIFYGFSILAIGLGIWAHRTIRRYPDMLTGRGLANAGIALGLAFGLAAGTITTVQYLVRVRQAEKYAREYAEVLNSPDMGAVLMLMAHPAVRANRTSADLLQDHVVSLQNERTKMELSMGPLGQLLALRKALAESKDEKVHFVRIEGVAEEQGHGLELQILAPALLELTGPVSAKTPEKRQYALALVKARPKGRLYEWWVEAVRFPYQPHTFVPPDKPAGDGHAHDSH